MMFMELSDRPRDDADRYCQSMAVVIGQGDMTGNEVTKGRIPGCK